MSGEEIDKRAAGPLCVTTMPVLPAYETFGMHQVNLVGHTRKPWGLKAKYLGFTGTWGWFRILRDSLRVQPTSWQVSRGKEKLGLSWVDTRPRSEKWWWWDLNTSSLKV